MAETHGNKILALDLSRTVAIVLAMFAHVLTTTGALEYVLENLAPLMLIVRTSTPMFIILFGVILEIVYRRRAERDGMHSVLTRFIERALLCWALYALANIPLLLTGQISLPYYLGTALLLGATPFTDILRYYTILFVLAPAILYARLRWGVLPLLVGSVGLMALHPFFAAIPDPDLPVAQEVTMRMVDLLVGIWDGTAGPSVLHSLFFVAVGITIGTALTSERSAEGGETRSNRTLLLLIAFLAVATYASTWVGPEEVNWASVSKKTLRNANHPFYFFNGALISTVIITALRGIQKVRTGPLRATMLGQRSLFTFSFGNAVLYAVMGPHEMPPLSAMMLSAVLLVVIFACSAIYDRIEPKEALASGSALRRISAQWLHRVIDPVNDRIRISAAWLTSRGWVRSAVG